jgi:hypothetical protein
VVKVKVVELLIAVNVVHMVIGGVNSDVVFLRVVKMREMG